MSLLDGFKKRVLLRELKNLVFGQLRPTFDEPLGRPSGGGAVPAPCLTSWSSEGTDIATAALGVTVQTITGVTLSDADVLHVVIAGVADTPPNVEAASVFWGVHVVPIDDSRVFSNSFGMRIAYFDRVIGTGEGGTADLVITYSVSDVLPLTACVSVERIANATGPMSALVSPRESATGTTPLTWSITPAGGVPSTCSFVGLSIVSRENQSGTAGSWLAPYSDGIRAGTTGTPAGGALTLSTGYRTGAFVGSETVGKSGGDGVEALGFALQANP